MIYAIINLLKKQKGNSELIYIHIDGATNATKSGVGIVLKENNTVYEYAFPLDTTSNQEAEFIALVKALAICAENFPNELIAVQSDSELVVQAVEKNFVKNPVFKPYLAQIMQLASTFPYFFIKWIPSEQNKHADRLAKAALNKDTKHLI